MTKAIQKTDTDNSYSLALQMNQEEKLDAVERQIVKDFLYLLEIPTGQKVKLPLSDDPDEKRKEIILRYTPEYLEGIDRLLKAQILPAMVRKIQQHFEDGEYRDMKLLIEGQDKLVGTMSKNKTPLVALQINQNGIQTGTNISDLKD